MHDRVVCNLLDCNARIVWFPAFLRARGEIQAYSNIGLDIAIHFPNNLLELAADHLLQDDRCPRSVPLETQELH